MTNGVRIEEKPIVQTFTLQKIIFTFFKMVQVRKIPFSNVRQTGEKSPAYFYPVDIVLQFLRQ